MKKIIKFFKTLILYLIVRILLWLFFVLYSIGLLIYVLIFKPIIYLFKLSKL